MPGHGGYTPVRPNERNRILENVALSVVTLVMPVSSLLKAGTVTAPLPQFSVTLVFLRSRVRSRFSDSPKKVRGAVLHHSRPSKKLYLTCGSKSAVQCVVF